ncbi:MAG: NifB/NifX family molybdenum-iron cluster-binding protein [Desulfovibrionaceae bacterium]
MTKIAIPSKKDGSVDEHFGHCEFFTIATVDENKTVVDEEMYIPAPGCGCKSNLAGVLKQMGVTQLVAGNMGEGAVAQLQKQGIAVVRGAQGPVQDALAAYLRGELKDADIICHAHDDGHECHHAHEALKPL